ncbi:UDP-N-acetylmuramoyl-tripeptide--D-alanyl-D-alanine ligase [Oceanicella sp. SM1341]|uniref:UDP-N-acetylmuramoyl-tripeptide--D-alanyl-D- alanine ligase n=1 Tax=Oceanicella sp. SM1341 TaxID=1548889 RepID=UPI000E4D2000|nr:UDP-N-acetylmuramoyl-tripeptide--D-alanyl-D-alanine ligase [Oceanicella sp. SM1341]
MSARAAAPLWTAEEAQAATGGTGPGGWVCSSVSADSRSLAKGALFVALSDARDGHDFVADALKAGAAAALVSRVPEGLPADAPLLVVADVLEGLRALGAAARARMQGKVIGVTGSMGKTGTKEMLRLALGCQGRVHAAEKSFNNHWGVPLTLAAMPRDTDYAVIEIGMNHSGEITPLTTLARPHVALVTNVAPVHLAHFASVSEIARAKAEIFTGLEPGGVAVINRDIATYRILDRAARKAGARMIRFGAAGRPELRLQRARVCDRATVIAAKAFGQELMFKLGAPGRHLALNALGALGAVAAAGADIGQAAVALCQWTAPAGRGARWVVRLGTPEIDGAFVLIDESYNANPSSVEAALELLSSVSPRDGEGRVSRGRRIAFLGDMLELGPEEENLHAGLASLPALSDISKVHCAGPRMRALHLALPARLRGEWHEDSAALASRVPRLVDAGDVVMVKGSLGARMARVVEALRHMGDARPDEPAPEEA